MDEFRYDSWCGIYCGACDVLVSCESRAGTGEVAPWEALPERFRRYLPIRGELVCHGCKTDRVFAGCAVCAVRTCASRTPGIGTCLDCSSYPCLRHRFMGALRWVFRLERKLPHLTEVGPNLAAIRRDGLTRWLEAQDARWRCPECGERYTWYQPDCRSCGRDLGRHRPFPCRS